MEMVLLHGDKLKKWEMALLLGIACAMLCGAALGAEQDLLADKVVRLHVVANSDSTEDQALKLQVRDAILAEATPDLAGLERCEVLEALEQELPQIARVAAEVIGETGYTYPVTVTLEEERFPTKQYDDFALPAGDYTALRVQIGSGEGHNWWCVMFPPLCMGSVEEVAELDDRDLALMTGETQGYVVKFRAIELWEEFKTWLD